MRGKGFFVAAALTALFLAPKATQASPNAMPVTGRFDRAVLHMINHDRRASGLPALHSARRLSSVALAHSLDMASHGYISHASAGGASPLDRISRAGIRYRIAGENIGWDGGSVSRAMLKAIERAMLQSPEHRANILRSTFTRIGIGIAVTPGRVYVTEDFKG